MPLRIRPATMSDVQQLVALETSVFAADRISRRGFRAMAAQASAAMLVAEDAAALAGYCVVLFRANSRKARLYSIAASPGRSGVGRLLLAAAEAASLVRGSSELRLEVRADNARAIALYESAGYHAFGRLDAYYADGATALRFRKPLGSNHAGSTGT